VTSGDHFLCNCGGAWRKMYSVDMRYSEAGIKPLFVFNGLNLMKKERGYNRNDSRQQKMANAWEAYYKGQKDTALLFQDSGLCCAFMAPPSRNTNTFLAERNIALPFVLNVCKYFKDHNIDYFRAPYLSWAQVQFTKIFAINLQY